MLLLLKSLHKIRCAEKQFRQNAPGTQGYVTWIVPDTKHSTRRRQSRYVLSVKICSQKRHATTTVGSTTPSLSSVRVPDTPSARCGSTTIAAEAHWLIQRAPSNINTQLPTQIMSENATKPARRQLAEIEAHGQAKRPCCHTGSISAKQHKSTDEQTRGSRYKSSRFSYEQKENTCQGSHTSDDLDSWLATL